MDSSQKNWELTGGMNDTQKSIPKWGSASKKNSGPSWPLLCTYIRKLGERKKGKIVLYIWNSSATKNEVVASIRMCEVGWLGK